MENMPAEMDDVLSDKNLEYPVTFYKTLMQEVFGEDFIPSDSDESPAVPTPPAVSEQQTGEGSHVEEDIIMSETYQPATQLSLDSSFESLMQEVFVEDFIPGNGDESPAVPTPPAVSEQQAGEGSHVEEDIIRPTSENYQPATLDPDFELLMKEVFGDDFMLRVNDHQIETQQQDYQSPPPPVPVEQNVPNQTQPEAGLNMSAPWGACEMSRTPPMPYPLMPGNGVTGAADHGINTGPQTLHDENFVQPAHVQGRYLPYQWPVSNDPRAAASTVPAAPPSLYNNVPALQLPGVFPQNLRPVGYVNGQTVYELPYGSAPHITSAPVTIQHQKEEKRHIKKPPNAFMLYRQEQRHNVVRHYNITDSAAVNKILGQKWKSLSKQEQARYYEEADRERLLHAQQHPEWSCRENYGKKRKRTRTWNNASTEVQAETEPAVDSQQAKRSRVPSECQDTTTAVAPYMTQPYITQPYMTQPNMTQPIPQADVTQPYWEQPKQQADMSQSYMTQPYWEQPNQQAGVSQPYMTQPIQQAGVSQPYMTRPYLEQPNQQAGVSQPYMMQPFQQADVTQPSMTQPIQQAGVTQPYMTQPYWEQPNQQTGMSQPYMTQPIQQAGVSQPYMTRPYLEQPNQQAGMSQAYMTQPFQQAGVSQPYMTQPYKDNVSMAQRRFYD